MSRPVGASALFAAPDSFRPTLLKWYDSTRRRLPWRESLDFYRIWLSEVMLQQTRVETVLPYYHRFLERFPTVEHLAAATENDILTAWSGLGYYSRARNLHRAARQLAERVPATFDEVRALPGAGPYTAAAIASIALGLPHAAVDGNVVRVLARLSGDASDISSREARQRFAAFAQTLLDPARPGDFNQAMMELGATICLPRTPMCARCPVAGFCAARACGTERELPVRLPKPKARRVPLDLILFKRDTRVFLVQRAGSERRLAGFWELPERHLFPEVAAAKLRRFTHSIVNDRFEVTVWTAGAGNVPDGAWFTAAELGSIPLTTITRKALEPTASQATRTATAS